MNVITKEFDKINRQITLECQVSEPSTPIIPDPMKIEITAIVDTGCMVTSISKRIIDQLGIKTPSGIKHTFNGANGSGTCTPYCIDLYLPEGIKAEGIKVDCLDNLTPDMLIGMDILQQGDMCISTRAGKGLFSFQVPQTHSTDYKEEIKKFHKIHEVQIKHGNNICPCGSGKKWDNCHGR